MKVALQLFGHMRTFVNCYPALVKNFLELHNVDIFIHTWDTIDHKHPTWHDAEKVQGTYDTKVDFEKQICKLYKPKAIKIDCQNLFVEEGLYGSGNKGRISLTGLRYMHYSKYWSNKLRKEYQSHNKVDYEYVVVTRPDIYLNKALDLRDFKKEFELSPRSSLHLVHNVGTKFFENKAIQIAFMGDLLYVLKSDTADMMGNSFTNFDFFFKDMMAVMPKGIDAPEVSFRESLRSLNIQPIFHKFDFTIKRANAKQDIKPPRKNKIKRVHKIILVCVLLLFSVIIGNLLPRLN
ncbi:hypothetical protein N8390_10695 [Amylibacter sp.]|nr:hypothetical protein [Amylibacter sp.]